MTVAHSNSNDKTPIIITIVVIKYNDIDDDDDDDDDDDTLYCKFDLHGNSDWPREFSPYTKSCEVIG